jgi:Tfp pilus assembly protein, ATPase PilM
MKCKFPGAGELCFACAISVRPVCETAAGRRGKTGQDHLVRSAAKCPFPLDEVVWDYQLVGGGLGEQIQVVLVAIKVDLLDQTNAAVEGTGLQTSIVDLAPMALYNAFRYSYPEVGDCSLLLDIGARTTNILFIESGRIFLRSIPLGGSAITAAIAREFNESFAAAETRKKRDGFVGWAALMPNLPIPTLRGFRKSRAAP